MVLVGASHGLGPDAALALGRAGARTVLVGPSLEPLEEVAAEVRAAGSDATAYLGDVADAEVGRGVVAAAEERFGRIDALVYNPALGMLRRAEDVPAEAVRRMLAVNLYGAFHLTRALLPRFAAQGHGHFIFVTGPITRRPLGHLAADCASMAALDAFAESLGQELADTKVQVTRFWPAAADTAAPDTPADHPVADPSELRRARRRRSRSRSAARRLVATLEHPRPFATGRRGLGAYARLNALSPTAADVASNLAARLPGGAKDLWPTEDASQSTSDTPPPAATPIRDVRDRVILVVGASGGVGAASAQALAERGARVVLAARSAERLETLRAEIERAGGTAAVQPIDVTDPTSVEQAVASIGAQHGPLEGLVYAAGVATLEPIAEMDAERLQTSFAVNYEGLVNCARAVVPGFRRQGYGAFVDVSVAIGERPFPNLAAFGAAKLAGNTYIRSLARELRGTAVGTALLTPGPVDTDFMANLLNANEANFALCMRERRALGLIPPERVGREVVRMIESGARERTFPLLLKLYVVFSNAVSVRLADQLVTRYMDWRRTPEACEMPQALRARLGDAVELGD